MSDTAVPEGRFRGDLHAGLSFNPATRQYRLRVWVWDSARRHEDEGSGWYRSTRGLREYPQYGNFEHERHWPAWRRGAAVRAYLAVNAERERRWIDHQECEATTPAWQLITTSGDL